MSIIVTGFEPFGGRAVNRSWQAVEAMTARIERVRLPVDYAQLAELVPALVARGPEALLLVGEAKRDRVTLERFARNACDPQKIDNTGASRDVVQIDGPAILEATWDVGRAMVGANHHAPVALSDHAGGFCCNAALWHALRVAPRTLPIGFVHVPIGDDPSVAQLAAALDAVVEALI